MDKSELDRHNARVIDEFRAHRGVVGGMYADSTLLLLHTVGARTRQPRVNPLVCLPLEGDAYAVFASAGGAPNEPDWYRNLLRNPGTRIEVGDQTIAVRGRVATGPERDVIWARQTERHPNFAEFPSIAGREIPVVVIDPLPR